MSTLENITRKHYLLRKRLDDSKLRYEALSVDVGEAKNRIELEPQVMGIMEELQRREHERAVGAYEELLTLFLRDVLPGYREVVMDLRTERSLPALDVYLRKGEGLPLEDALSGTGGSVTNILSAGLRFIALVRSGNRPFLVLDEPDCWIKPELAPKFAAVVQSVAEQLGVQVLMISHHDEQMFENLLPHRLRLEKNDRNLVAQWAPTASSPQWQDDQPGMRSIELIDFQSHAHTIIPLSPGLTLINGDNDIGKSAVVSALRGVFDADSNDQHIRHGAKSARVILDFGPEKVLTWERFRKGSHKAVYELREAGTAPSEAPIRKSIGAREVPEWVREFGIGLIDDLDVQLANQKDPVFLLGKTARERAKALAIGGENAHVQEMLNLGKQELGEAKISVKSGEREMENLHRSRQILEPLEKRDEVISNLEMTACAINDARLANEHMEALLLRWQRIQSHRNLMAPILRPMPQLPQAPSGHQSELALAKSWMQARKIRMVLAPLDKPFNAVIPQAPSDPGAGRELLRRWTATRGVANATKILSIKSFVSHAPEIHSVHAQDLPARWRTANGRVMALRALSSTSMPPLLPPPGAAFSRLAHDWQMARDRRNILARSQATPMPTLLLPPEINAEGTKLLDRWGGGRQATAEARQQMQLADEEFLRVQHEMKAQAQDTCKTCGRPMDHAHSLR